MNTTSSLLTSDPDDQSSDLDCSRFTFVAYVIVFGAMCAFGLVGNGLSWAVLSWERRNSGRVATFLLQTMAVVDNSFLLTAGISHITTAVTLYIESITTAATDEYSYSAISNHSSERDVIAMATTASDDVTGTEREGSSVSVVVGAYIKAYVTVCVWPLVHVTQLFAVWITVLVAFNRYVAICRPFQAHKLCTMRQARIQAAALGAAIIVYSIPRFLEYRIDYVADEKSGGMLLPKGTSTELKGSFLYNIVYENLLYCLFVFLGPLAILIALNACLVHELVMASRRLKERRLPTDCAADQGEQNLTLVMVVIIVIFVVCQSPAFVNQLLYYLIGDQYACGNAYFYYFHISNLLVSANSSVNFVVYCIFRRQFRRRLYKFCCGGRASWNRRHGDSVTLCTKDHHSIDHNGQSLHHPLKVTVT